MNPMFWSFASLLFWHPIIQEQPMQTCFDEKLTREELRVLGNASKTKQWFENYQESLKGTEL